MTATTVFYRAL